jgi:ribonuclease-3
VTSAANWSHRQLDYKFSDAALLDRALTHKSRSSINNERLEFLGDAVLGAVIADVLHQTQPEADEGALSRLRAHLVRRETLAEIAADIKLGDILVLGSGESRSGGHQRESILADTLEAVLGAAYLDGGFATAQAVILHLFEQRLAGLPDTDELKDSKTRLQENLQARTIDLPAYLVLSESGPPHNRRFVVECSIPQLEITAQGEGTSRRRAEQFAAADALELIINDGS